MLCQAGDAMKKMMAAGGMKPEKVSAIAGIEKKEDFAAATAGLLAEGGVLAAAGQLDKAIEQLFALEKKCRLGNDINSLKAVVTGMCQLCKDQANWEKLSATIATISKRHQQHRNAITAVLVLVRRAGVDTIATQNNNF
jgi:ribulose-5-phosphate 4-epimerase/fuculose-1-phosphate aldolase